MWPILRIAPLPEEQRILHRIDAKRVIEDVAVIHLLAGGDLSRLRIASVVKPTPIRFPLNAGCAGAIDKSFNSLPVEVSMT